MSTRVALRLACAIGQPVTALSEKERRRFLERGRLLDQQVAQTVSTIIEWVQNSGDEALRELARRYDGVQLVNIEVPRSAWDDALQRLDPVLRAALEQAVAAIRTFHRAQLPRPVEIEVRRDVLLARRTEPLSSVAVYAPGGRAAYPSSVLMGVVPARVAGVRKVVVTSPPGPDGLPPAAVLAAAALAGADHVYALGGAGAVAALALGTNSVTRVDKIVGPGNAYTTEAKRQLSGRVAIDGAAGPSEILILADDSTDPELCALELLAQAEHDPDAASVLVCTDARVIDAVAEALERRLSASGRRAISEAALATQGALLWARDEEEMLSFAESYAPEHLLLLTREPRRTLEHVRAAGSVFLGPRSSVAFGDYITGANHVLPTAGQARVSSGLSVQDFLRGFTVQEVGPSAAAELAAATSILADAEGLPAHGDAARYQKRSHSSADTSPVLRPAYRDLTRYDPQRVPCPVDLSDNTNLFGVAPAIERLFSALPAARITRYPSVFGNELKEAIARWFGVAPQNVVTGCGSDDVIDSAIRAFCETGDRVVFPDPTFGVVSTFARMNATEPVSVPLTGLLELDVTGLVAAGGRVTYVCRPNNPTGTLFAAEDIEQLAARVPGVLLLDEAYADFAGHDLTRFAAHSTRVLSLRTFSKAFGLAGLRIGFAIGPAELVYEVEKSRGPYKVNSIAEAAGVTALSEAGDWIRAGIAQVQRNREQLFGVLTERGYRCWPSGGNFLLVAASSGQSAAAMAAGLRNRGVAVRPFAALPQLGDCVRVTIGPWPLMERFLAELSA